MITVNRQKFMEVKLNRGTSFLDEEEQCGCAKGCFVLASDLETQLLPKINLGCAVNEEVPASYSTLDYYLIGSAISDGSHRTFARLSAYYPKLKEILDKYEVELLAHSLGLPDASAEDVFCADWDAAADSEDELCDETFARELKERFLADLATIPDEVTIV